MVWSLEPSRAPPQQMAGQARNLTRWLRLCSSASHVSLLHHLVTGITRWCVCLSIPCLELQLLHYWGQPLSGNSSAWFETELLIFPNPTGVVRNLHAWYGFPKVVPLWLTSICYFLHLQLLLATQFPFWEEVTGSSDMLPYLYLLHSSLVSVCYLLHSSQLVGRGVNRKPFFFPVAATLFS